jgi:hypothetical protein
MDPGHVTGLFFGAAALTDSRSSTSMSHARVYCTSNLATAAASFATRVVRAQISHVKKGSDFHSPLSLIHRLFIVFISQVTAPTLNSARNRNSQTEPLRGKVGEASSHVPLHR